MGAGVGVDVGSGGAVVVGLDVGAAVGLDVGAGVTVGVTVAVGVPVGGGFVAAFAVTVRVGGGAAVQADSTNAAKIVSAPDRRGLRKSTYGIEALLAIPVTVIPPAGRVKCLIDLSRSDCATPARASCIPDQVMVLDLGRAV